MTGNYKINVTVEISNDNYDDPERTNIERTKAIGGNLNYEGIQKELEGFAGSVIATTLNASRDWPDT